MIGHQNKHLEVREFQCVECLKQLISRKSLLNHVYRNHRVPLEFPCSVCGILYQSKNDLQQHEEFHMGIRDVDTVNNDSLACSVCKKVFKCQNNLTTHMKLHSGETCECLVCGKHYTSTRGLKEHVTLKHEQNSKFKCQLCGKAFAKEVNLQVHSSTHLKPFQCLVCYKGYLAKDNLSKHTEKEHQQHV